MIRTIFLFSILVFGGCHFSLAKQTPSQTLHATEHQNIDTIKTQATTGSDQTAEAQKTVEAVAEPLLNMDKDNWDANRAKALLAVGELRGELAGIKNNFGLIVALCEAHFALITADEKLDTIKDQQITHLESQITQLQDKWTGQIKDMIVACAGLCLLGALGLAIAGAILKKPALIVDGGICLLGFFCCIAGVVYYQQMAFVGVGLLLVGVATTLYHVYQEFKTTNNALTAAVATVNVVKSQLDPAKVQDVMTNQIAPLQAAAGATAKITAVRAKIEGATNGNSPPN